MMNKKVVTKGLITFASVAFFGAVLAAGESVEARDPWEDRVQKVVEKKDKQLKAKKDAMQAKLKKSKEVERERLLVEIKNLKKRLQTIERRNNSSSEKQVLAEGYEKVAELYEKVEQLDDAKGYWGKASEIWHELGFSPLAEAAAKKAKSS